MMTRMSRFASVVIVVIAGIGVSVLALHAAPRDMPPTTVSVPTVLQQPSPNGRIAFVSARDGTYQICTVRPNGLDLHRLTNDTKNDYAPIWSPDGRKIAFLQSSGEPQHTGMYSYPPEAGPRISVIVMNADGSGERDLAPQRPCVVLWLVNGILRGPRVLGPQPRLCSSGHNPIAWELMCEDSLGHEADGHNG